MNTEPVRASGEAAPGINATGLVLACCAAGAAKAIEPPFWIFVPPGAELFNAGWTDIRFLTSISAIVEVVFLLAGIALLTSLVIAVGVRRSLRFRKGGIAASAMLD